jgi:hypothetical protein
MMKIPFLKIYHLERDGFIFHHLHPIYRAFWCRYTEKGWLHFSSFFIIYKKFESDIGDGDTQKLKVFLYIYISFSIDTFIFYITIVTIVTQEKNPFISIP